LNPAADQAWSFDWLEWSDRQHEPCGALSGPDVSHVYIYKRHLGFCDLTRWGRFVEYPEQSGPLRVIGRELALGLGSSFVMYVPEWATEEVQTDELNASGAADQIRPGRAPLGLPVHDLTGLPDEADLRTFFPEDSDDRLGYFIEYVA
jgi:hypothetical protein